MAEEMAEEEIEFLRRIRLDDEGQRRILLSNDNLATINLNLDVVDTVEMERFLTLLEAKCTYARDTRRVPPGRVLYRVNDVIRNVNVTFRNRVMNIYLRSSDLYLIDFRVQDKFFCTTDNEHLQDRLPENAISLNFEGNYCEMAESLDSFQFSPYTFRRAFDLLANFAAAFRPVAVGKAKPLTHKLKPPFFLFCVCLCESLRFDSVRHFITRQMRPVVNDNSNTQFPGLHDLVHTWGNKSVAYERWRFCQSRFFVDLNHDRISAEAEQELENLRLRKIPREIAPWTFCTYIGYRHRLNRPGRQDKSQGVSWALI